MHIYDASDKSNPEKLVLPVYPRSQKPLTSFLCAHQISSMGNAILESTAATTIKTNEKGNCCIFTTCEIRCEFIVGRLFFSLSFILFALRKRISVILLCAKEITIFYTFVKAFNSWCHTDEE